MSTRIHAARVIARRGIFETIISPGYYLALSIGLLLGYSLITGFVKSVDSSGFNFQLNPVYGLIYRSFEGAFGKTFVEQLFAEGPFLFALFVSFSPVFLYLMISSVFRFGLEKKVGAIELLTYGPADGSAYFMASMIKDILLTGLTMVVLLIFLFIAALLNNFVLGPMVSYSFLMLFFLATSIYAYGILASVITENPASAIAIFIGVMAFFVVIMMGSFIIVSSYVRNLASVFAWMIQWFSPYFYWGLALRAVEAGNTGFFGLSLAFLGILTATILLLSHIILRVKGVRG